MIVNAFLQEDVSLPDAPNIRIIPNEAKVLIASKVRLENFWKHSSYHLEEAAPKTSKIILLISFCFLHSIVHYYFNTKPVNCYVM